MKNMMIYKSRVQNPMLFGVITLLAVLNFGCGPELVPWEPDSTDMVITDYVYENEETFTEFGNLLMYTGVENLLRVRGPFTLLLPTDEAMKLYYQENNISSYESIDVEIARELVYNHVFQGEITSGSIGLGAMLYPNILGDNVASEFAGIDVLINKTALIVDQDVYTANGVIHHIDKVLPPINESVFDVLSTYSGYSIFLEALVETGISDTLDIIDFPYGTTTGRSRYTILAVPDTLYQRKGINSLNDLRDTLDARDSQADADEALLAYVDYHCLTGTNYFSDFEIDGNYYIMAGYDYLNIKVEDDFKINKQDTSYTGFFYELSNIPAKNGVIHTVNTLLEVEETEPSTIIHQTTDYFDLQQGSYYLNYYQRFYDGQNTFENIKWEGEFLLYYLKTGHHLQDDDCINLNGHFEVEITTPKIRKGDYTLSGFFFFGGGHAVLATYIDDEYLGICDLTKGSWGGDPLKFGDGEVSFDKTESHTIRIKTVVPGSAFWDYVKFTPKK